MKQVAAAIAYRGDQVLVTRRAPGQHLEGYWEFPGGKLEDGECVARCIERELQEELSDLANVGPFSAEQSVYLGYHRQHVFKHSPA